MAQSRLEKIGTIYCRITNLIKGGVLKDEDVPLWYSVYKAFPPKYEPKYDRPGSQVPVQQIFYNEDIIRAKFQNDFRNVHSDLTTKGLSKTQKFIEEYGKLEKEGVPESELYKKTKEKYISLLEKSKEPKEPIEIRKEKNVQSSLRMEDLFKEASKDVETKP